MSVDVQTLAAVVTVAVAAASGLSALLAHWLARRAASGRVSTSEASVLWQQSQDMREMLLTEKARAEEQRDRLIDAYTRQVFPVLTEINATVVAMAGALTEALAEVRAVRSSLEGGGHEAAGPLAPPDARADAR